MTGKVPVPLRGQDVTGKEKALRKLTDREDEGQLLSWCIARWSIWPPNMHSLISHYSHMHSATCLRQPSNCKVEDQPSYQDQPHKSEGVSKRHQDTDQRAGQCCCRSHLSVALCGSQMEWCATVIVSLRNHVLAVHSNQPLDCLAKCDKAINRISVIRIVISSHSENTTFECFRCLPWGHWWWLQRISLRSVCTCRCTDPQSGAA